jgi:metal-responsive CopG/Arc/MetJ family transcriptional regulator
MAPRRSFTLPESSRFTFTIQKDLLKEVRKFSIDYEVDERDIPEIAMRYLMRTYANMEPQDRAKGLSLFVPGCETEEPEGN